jgi:hypothetical protein
VSVKPGQKSCVIKSIKSAYTLTARSLVKHIKGDEASDWITSRSPVKLDNANRRILVSNQNPPGDLNPGP